MAGNGTMTRLGEWVRHPFASNMSAMDWLLWLGLVVIGIFLWTRILNKIVE